MSATPAAEHPLAGGAVMVMTRFRLRSPLLLPLALLRFRSVGRAARAAPGFVRGSVSVAGPRVIINVSVWRSREEMLWWVGLQPHLTAARQMYRWIDQCWSAEARDPLVSQSAGVWE